MPRTIKFRAWHKKEKRMSKLFTLYDLIGYDDGCVYIDGFGEGDEIEDPAWKIMEFTGLFDKNGKEIYEGDIVKVEWDDFPDDIYVCEWDEKFAGFEFSDKDKDMETFLGGARYKYIEVIGNIHEDAAKSSAVDKERK